MVRIVSYNIERGKRFDEIMHWLLDLDPKPTLVCMQEFPEDKLALLRQTLEGWDSKYNFKFAPGTTDKKMTVGQVTIFDNGKMPMVGFEVVPIGVMKIEKLVSRHDGRKSALITKHKIKGKEFVVVNLHLGAYTSNKRRQRQLEMLVAKVGEGTKPTLLVGDFNFSSILGGRAWKKMLLENGFAPLGGRKVTHRIGKVVAHQLDYVFAKNCAVELFEVERKVKFSDHYPVMSEIGGGI